MQQSKLMAWGLISSLVGRQAMYRGRAELEDGVDIRGAVHRLRHLCEGAPPAAG